MKKAAITLLAIGSIGVIGATILEIIYREPVYALMMKLCPWLIGMGSIMLGVCLSRRKK